MKFRPLEVLFSPTEACNLRCSHCHLEKSNLKLPVSTAKKFLKECRNTGVKKLGFTGGEPFLYPEFLYKITKQAVSSGLYFDCLMTNGVWYKDKEHLYAVLSRLNSCGYDGKICVSVDAFHNQNLDKVALFIKTAFDVWNRGDLISIASVIGKDDEKTINKLEKLAYKLNGRFKRFSDKTMGISCFESFIQIALIELSGIGKIKNSQKQWDGRWFREDFCEGPGNVFMVMSDGSVKPCCGYANHHKLLTIGNIFKDTPGDILNNIKNNFFTKLIFTIGLTGIRKKMERWHIKFPGATGNQCFFCNYLLENFSENFLKDILINASE